MAETYGGAPPPPSERRDRPLSCPSMSDTARPQLIRIEVDRRLGHEWDEWDGKPLPNHGNYDSPPRLFFLWSAAGLAAALGVVALGLYLLGPRIGLLVPGLPTYLWVGLGVVTGAAWLWWLLILGSYALKRSLLPGALAERGPFLRLMRVTSRVADRFGRRDWVENAAVKVYNALAVVRARAVGKGELLLLIPRCLSKAALDGVLALSGKYEVPVFVATRGQLATAGHQGAAAAGGGGGGLRARHGERAPRRGGPRAGARASR